MDRRLLVLSLVCLLVPVLAACQGNSPNYRSSGQVTPTVAGGPAPAYGGYGQARDAFTRTSGDGVVTATLKDAAWIRFEGDPDGALKRHRSYFEGVATVFQVVFRPKDHVRCTQEVFILEDSSGLRLTASPKRYEGEMLLVDDRFQFTFDLKYAHAITNDLRWIRLTHEGTGEVVEWSFGAPAAGGAVSGS
ncbi:MAG: hypothetical protein QNJ98_14145 [Planctomycetota bacterium]|nr:hypothetical protein [Planctomycetota bacterium]